MVQTPTGNFVKPKKGFEMLFVVQQRRTLDNSFKLGQGNGELRLNG